MLTGQSTIFSEDFGGFSNGTTSDPGRWYSFPPGSENYFEVRNGRFEGDDLDGEATWETDTFDISNCDSVRFSLDAIEADDLESGDHFDVYYSTDGGSTYTLIQNWNGLGDASHTLIGDKPDNLDWGGTNSSPGGSETISKNGITGSKFILRVVMDNNAELMALDNVLIEGYACVPCSHSISSFSPSEGCPDTGTVTVSINGSGFQNGTGTSDVQFDGSSSPSFTVLSDNQIEAEVPTNASDGPVTVVTDGCSETGISSFDVTCTACHQLFVNEFSNGESGLREYVELIVGNDCGGCYADLSGWIVDDNEGTFSGGPSTGEGIAQGHLRFDPNADWDSIPTGSIIVIYNASDKNLTIDNLPLNDDPMDSNGDSVYVIPSDHPNLQECSSIPNTSDSSYSPCSYSSTSTWSPMAMSNTQDAIQTRKPDESYFHGISYGNDPDFDGGPDSLHVHNASGTDDVFSFVTDSIRNVGDWSQGTATSSLSTTDETPGSPNNASNADYIDSLACSASPCLVNADFTVNDSTQCASGNSFDFTNTGSSSGFDHSWQFGDGQSSTLENPKHSYSDSASYQVRLITDSSSNCSDTAYKTVTVGKAATSIAPADTLTCSRAEDTLDASSSFAWPGNPSYSWSSSGGNIISGSNTATAVVDEAGTYKVVLSEDSVGCADSIAITVVQDTVPPSIDTTNLSVGAVPCGDTNGTITGVQVTNGTGPFFNIWTDASGDTVQADTNLLDLDSLGAGPYHLTVRGANGCVDSLGPIDVPAQGGPDASFTLAPSQGKAPLEVSFTDQSTGADAYQWWFGDGNGDSVRNPTHNYEEEGSYTVRLIVRGPNGCVDSAFYRSILVKEADDLFIPNGVSANGDGLNDVFHIRGLENYPENSLKIFNRWGQLIYSADPYKNDWKGQSNKGELVEGTYFYVLELGKGKGKRSGFIEFHR